MGEEEATTTTSLPSNGVLGHHTESHEPTVDEEHPSQSGEEGQTSTEPNVYTLTHTSTPPGATIAAQAAVATATAAASLPSSSVHITSPSAFLPLKRPYGQVHDISNMRNQQIINTNIPGKGTHIQPAGDASESFRRAQEAAANEALAGLPKRRHSGVKRGTNFTGAEGLILAKAWVDLTDRAPEDGANIFWEQVAEQFVRAGGAVRTPSSLKIKWCELHRTTIKWLQARDQVISVSETDCTDEDILAATMKLYREIGKSNENGEIKYPSNFKFVDAAMFLKNSPAFSMKYLKNPKSTVSTEALPDVVEEVVASSQAERRRLLQNGTHIITQQQHNGSMDDVKNTSIGIENQHGQVQTHAENGDRERLFSRAYKASKCDNNAELMNRLNVLTETVNALTNQVEQGGKSMEKYFDRVTKILLCQLLPEGSNKNTLLAQFVKETFQMTNCPSPSQSQGQAQDVSVIDLLNMQVGGSSQRTMQQQTDSGRGPTDSDMPFHNGK